MTSCGYGDGRHVWVKLYTPEGLNLFEKPCPCLIIENFNLIVKLEKQSVNRISFLRGFEVVILVDRFS
jgi:hypothetical protein